MRCRIGEAGRIASLFVCLACGDPADEPVAERELALDDARCSLGAECERWGTLIEEPPLPELACNASAEPAAPPVWFQPLPPASCPFGSCALYDQQLSLDTDGSLVALSAARLPSQYGFSGSEGGLWITRHSAQGRLLGSQLWDFSAPPPGIEIARHGLLLRDDAGRALFLSSRDVQPFAAPRALSVRGLTRSLALSATVFSTASGWGVLAARAAGNDWIVAGMRTLAPGRSEASLARHDQRGRALWVRSWPQGSEVRALQVARDHGVVVIVSDAASDTQTLYRLDKRGAVVWRRVLTGASRFDTAQVATARDGSLFLAWSSQSDFESSFHIQQLAFDGHQLAAWQITQIIALVPCLASDERGQPMLALPGFDAAFMPTIDWFSFDQGACQRTSYQLPTNMSAQLDRVAIQADRRGARFFATNQVIGQLREREEP